jgi:hypothetical protein
VLHFSWWDSYGFATKSSASCWGSYHTSRNPCGPQKSRTLFQPKLKDPFGVLRPEFIHVTMTEAPRILLILKSDGVFGTHRYAAMDKRRAIKTLLRP